jgi:hypothetical protein
MAFTLQDDTGLVTDANAYIDATFYKTYQGDRGVDVTLFTDPEVQQAIIIATDYIDTRFRYVGDRQNDRSDQTTEWPRLDAVDRDHRLLNGIPLVVKQACAEYTLFQLTNGPLFVTTTNSATGRAIKRSFSKVDVIEEETEYFQGPVGAEPPMPVYHVADQRLISAGIVEGPSGKLARA